MDMFDFEELMAEVFGLSDDDRDNGEDIAERFSVTFGFEFEQGYELAKVLLLHTAPVEAGVSGKKFHAFVSKKQPVMLMKQEADE